MTGTKTGTGASSEAPVVLALNTGSSTVKYRLFALGDAIDSGDTGAAPGDGPGAGRRSGRRRVLADGQLELSDDGGGKLTHRSGDGEPETTDLRARDHREALDHILATVERDDGLPDDLAGALTGVGHRVVHGGDRFDGPVIVDDDVAAAIDDLAALAPLHNPGNLAGIEAARAAFPGVPQVAVFDTAFHRTLPPRAARYALPRDLADRHHLHRYGFHGISHQYVARRAAAHLGRQPADVNLITLHVGNGASAAAIQGGRSVDTSMGLTPLAGLVMGTRSGDLDPAVVLYLLRHAGMGVDDVERLLNRQSGMAGLTGTGDLRDVQRQADDGDEHAREALDLYCYHIRTYVGAYAAALGRVDAVVFTGGVGEHSSTVRAMACNGLGILGIRLDEASNEATSSEARTISADDSRVPVLVVPTDEELEIAEQTLRVVRND